MLAAFSGNSWDFLKTDIKAIKWGRFVSSVFMFWYIIIQAVTPSPITPITNVWHNSWCAFECYADVPSWKMFTWLIWRVSLSIPLALNWSCKNRKLSQHSKEHPCMEKLFPFDSISCLFDAKVKGKAKAFCSTAENALNKKVYISVRRWWRLMGFVMDPHSLHVTLERAELLSASPWFSGSFARSDRRQLRGRSEESSLCVFCAG